MYHLGWKTLAQQVEEQAKLQEGFEVTCVRVVAPLWLRLLVRELPRPFKRSLVPLATGWRWYVARKYRKLILEGGFETVCVNSQVLAFGLLDLCKQAATRLAISLDVTGPAYARDLLNLPIDEGAFWAEEATLYEAADLIVPWSEWIAQSLVDDFKVSRQKIIVMPPAVDTNAFRENDKLRGAGRLPKILFCGNDWERKGGPRLVRWHQDHWAEKAELHIASAKAVVPPGLKNVVLHGSVPHARLRQEILPSASIFCMPTWQDMSPYVLSEAQATGLPCVSSRVGGIPELVIHGKTGFVIPPHDDAGFLDAITRLLDDPALRLEMGRAARQHAVANLDATVLFKRLFDRLAG